MTTHSTVTLSLGSTEVVAEVADTDPLRERGLGGRNRLEEGRGMWFVFDTDELWAFWMKDTLIPLDIIWVAADGTIVTIAPLVAPESFPEVFRPTQPARYVLEVPAGFAAKHGIAEGQKIVVQ
ncbi:MAG: response regulator MprA [Candidatus Adlerbacteria bacterium]|nr:response regulator MprA [Candidatus Adlerbacteria bacterium]